MTKGCKNFRIWSDEDKVMHYIPNLLELNNTVVFDPENLDIIKIAPYGNTCYKK